jgi:hypothetical protein
MKQYTDKYQTTKLIELGFPEPQGWGNACMSNKWVMDISPNGKREDFNYSIGELIEFLCPHFQTTNYKLTLQKIQELSWDVEVEDVNYNDLDYQIKQELIDALFCACVTLKEEGVI